MGILLNVLLNSAKHTYQLILVMVILVSSLNLYSAPTIGSTAPNFTLKDQYGNDHSLIDYKGQWVVLYFYPRDNTPGCTIEAGSFRDNQKNFSAKNTVILGISLDDVESHLDFSKTMDLNFSILADTNKDAAKKYDVLTDLGLIAYTSRETFIIDPEGRIAHHFEEVEPKQHTAIVIKKLNELSDIYK